MSLRTTIIADPEYVVDFAEFLPRKTEQSRRGVSDIAISTITFIGVVFESTYQAGYLTLHYSLLSARYIPLRMLGTASLLGAIYEVVYWILGVGFSFVATASRLVLSRYASSNELYLSQFIGHGINPHHIRTRSCDLDASGVPTEIQVSRLADLLSKVNFTDPSAPGYMPPTLRVEDRKEYSVEELKRHLSVLIGNIQSRTPFIGTPPAHDIVRLQAFYQQIEDAIRLSLQAVIGEMDAFLEVHGQDATTYTQDEAREHKNLLENQARLAIDLAIAGAHCGARYMGDAMSSYTSFCQETSPAETLEDQLIEVLAAKRSEIARGQVERIFGRSTQSVHGFTKYMQHMGGLLAIPGTENVIEHLASGAFDYDRRMQSFFAEYTEDVIIDTVQDAIKKSQPLRELVLNWFKEQNIPAWRSIPDPDPTIQTFEVIKNSEVSIDEPMRVITLFQEMLNQSSHIEVGDNWADFIEEVFALESSKAAFDTKYRECNTPISRARKRQAVKQFLQEGPIAQLLEERYSNTKTIEVDAALREVLSKAEKIRRMRETLPVAEDVLLRILEGEAAIATVVQGYLERQLQTEFLQALNVDTMATDGLSPLLLEWLLNAHHIFTPKSIDVDEFPGQHLTNPERYVRLITARFQAAANRGPTRNTKRYAFSDGDVEADHWQSFEAAFAANYWEICRVARETADMTPYLMPWEERSIQLLTFISDILDSLFITIFLVATGLLVMFESINLLATLSAVSYEYLIRTAPNVVMQADRVFSIASNILTYVLLAEIVFRVFPNPVIRNIGKRISVITNLIFLNNHLVRLFNTVFFPLNLAKKLSLTCKGKATHLQAKQRALYKKGCYALFKKALAETTTSVASGAA